VILRLALFCLCVLGLLAPAEAHPQKREVPANDGWVTDQAGLISPAKEAELERLIESYREGTTHEIAVLTVPNLAGEPIEDFALRVGRAWGIGTKERNNAALLVISKEDRAIRIESARGLEGSLPDAIASRIIRDVIAPSFKQGKFEQGIEAGVRAMHAAIGGDYAALPKRTRAPDVGVLGALLPMLFFLFFLIVVIASRRGGGRGPRGRSGMPWIFPPFPLGGGIGRHGGGGGFGGFGGGRGGGGFGGFGGGGGFSGGGASGGW
jgi:uncharacterized protein